MRSRLPRLPWCLFGVVRVAIGRSTRNNPWPPPAAESDGHSLIRRRRLPTLLIAALVIGLHAGVIAMLLARPGRIVLPRELPSLEVAYLLRSAAVTALAPQAPSRPVRRPVGSGARAETEGSPPANLQLLQNPVSKTAPAETPPAIDWAGEIETQAARAAASQAPQFKDFGFPRSAEPAPMRAPEFAWDYARTHRVESLPEGGIVINLSDNCVLVLNPFPLPFCWPGKKPANGDLFKDMKR